MCDPFSLAVTSGVVGAAGSLYSGVQQSSAMKANAAALDVQAKAREDKAAFDLERSGVKFAQQQGAARAVMATSGFTTESFSDVLANDVAEAELEKAAIRMGATNDVRSIRTQAANTRSQAGGVVIGSMFSAAGAVTNAAAGYYRGKLGTDPKYTANPYQ